MECFLIAITLRCTLTQNGFGLVWFGLVLWHINRNRLFNAKSIWDKLGEVVPVRVPSMGSIDLLKNYSFSIGQCAKKVI